MRASNHGSAIRLIVIDDEADMLSNYVRLLSHAGYECAPAANAKELENLLKDFQPHLVLTDLMMPGWSGMDVLRRVKESDPGIAVIFVTAYGTVEAAVEAMKGQAADFLTKPFTIEELLGKLQAALSSRLMRAGSQEESEAPPDGAEGSPAIIGASPVMSQVMELARKVAPIEVNVLVCGESGTGKELIARAIHGFSRRRNEIFVPVDCASLPENLLESELFGYRKGAFTGAASDKMGLFEFAHRGTLFLDEVGEIPISLQAKLLRVLQERRFRPLGGREEIEVDIRLIAATNRDLDQAIEERTFRSDLYYRLNVIKIALPSLRERMEDIPALASHFILEFCKNNRIAEKRLTVEAMRSLLNHTWPGNVRELQNMMERAVALASGPTIGPEDLPEEVRRHSPATPLSEEGEAALARISSAEALSGASGLFASKGVLVRDFERKYLISLLLENRLNISQAAHAAGCHRRTLYRMIQKHGLDLSQLRQTGGREEEAVGQDSREQ